MTRVRRCRECGCTDKFACEGGCSWVAPDLCSACGQGDLFDATFHELFGRTDDGYDDPRGYG